MIFWVAPRTSPVWPPTCLRAKVETAMAAIKVVKSNRGIVKRAARVAIPRAVQKFAESCKVALWPRPSDLAGVRNVMGISMAVRLAAPMEFIKIEITIARQDKLEVFDR